MAIIMKIDPTAWAAWVADRPEKVRDLCARLPSDRLYRMKSSGHRCTLVSYNEDGTVCVAVTGQYNLVSFDRMVFGVPADDLEECELPLPGEPLGTAITDPEEALAFIRSRASQQPTQH